MSHFSKVETVLRDFDTLVLTLSDIGIEQHSIVVAKPDITIKQQNDSDISFVWDNEKYNLVADLAFWQQKYCAEVFLSKISQRYAYNLITNEGEKQGLQYVKETKQANGSIKLVLERWN